MATQVEVTADGREGHEVALHAHHFTALAKHLLKDTWIEAGNEIGRFKPKEKEEEGRRGEGRRKLTPGWTPQKSPAEVPPHCPPSWCETESCSSPLPSQCSPLLEEGLCSHLCRP